MAIKVLFAYFKTEFSALIKKQFVCFSYAKNFSSKFITFSAFIYGLQNSEEMEKICIMKKRKNDEACSHLLTAKTQMTEMMRRNGPG
jgi:hypothetical protein